MVIGLMCLRVFFLYLLTKQQENYFINICLVMTKKIGEEGFDLGTEI